MSEYVRRISPDSLFLHGVVSLDTVVDYRNELIELVAASDVDIIRIDLGSVEIKGSVVLSLLISLVRESRKLQKQVIFQHCSENLLAVARANSVDDILQLT